MKPSVYLSQSFAGDGIFSKHPIKKGEILFFLTGRVVDLKGALELGERKGVVIQIGSEEYINPTFPALFINHSCSPSAGIIDDFRFSAIRDIDKGEEVTLDYSTTMLERMWEMDCICGAANCRKTIRDFDLIPKEIQNRYLRMGLVQSFIVETLKKGTQALSPAA